MMVLISSAIACHNGCGFAPAKLDVCTTAKPATTRPKHVSPSLPYLALSQSHSNDYLAFNVCPVWFQRL